MGSKPECGQYPYWGTLHSPIKVTREYTTLMKSGLRGKLSSKRKGVIIVTFALGTFMLCGFAGLALDVTYLQMWKRRAQTAADAAAQSAAIELKRTQSLG